MDSLKFEVVACGVRGVCRWGVMSDSSRVASFLIAKAMHANNGEISGCNALT